MTRLRQWAARLRASYRPDARERRRKLERLARLDLSGLI